jgi:hypothetical protein
LRRASRTEVRIEEAALLWPCVPPGGLPCEDPLAIDFAITEDNFDGAPVVPGFAGDGDFLGVRRAAFWRQDALAAH